MDNLYDKLNNLEGNWSNTPAAEGGFGRVPDGPYICEIVEMGVRESKAGVPYVSWELEIAVGPHAGRKVFHSNRLETAQNISYLKADLGNTGLAVPARLIDLPDAVRDLIGRTVKVTLRTKGEYQDSYIDGLATRPTANATPAINAADDIPF